MSVDEATSIHEQVLITHEHVNNRQVSVDKDIVDLVLALWDMHFSTRMSCQDDAKGMIWLDFYGPGDALRFVDILFRVGEWRKDGVNKHALVRKSGSMQGGQRGYSVRFPKEWKQSVIECLRGSP